ncbi:MAG: hypothetical protein ACREQQ_13355, partial [Candidatus Binatia bacterium]
AAARTSEPQPAGAFAAGNPELVFLPYYRLIGWDLGWRKPAAERRQDPSPDPFGLDPDRPDARVAALLAKFSEEESDDVEFHVRHIERSFLALDLPGAGLYSLGMRPNALRLELYRREAVESLGRVVDVAIAPEAALEIGRKSGDARRTAYRTVIGSILSIVYFPFWLVEIRRAGKSTRTIVDGVSRTLVERQTSPDLLEKLGGPPAAEPAVAAFRPLVCPNCGWDLPLAADAVIFPCRTCAKAWEIIGAELVETRYRLAALPDRAPAAGIEHLPFWALSAEISGESRKRYLVPGFRHRRMKSLVDLTSSLSAIDPPLEVEGGQPEEAKVCHFDETDAAELALFAHAGSSGSYARAERAREDSIRVDEHSLVWIPFLADPYSLRDPYGGVTIARRLLG